MAGPLPTAESFQREYGCTVVEWRRWLPDATQHAPVLIHEPARLRCQIAAGHLTLDWQELAPRRIALISLPRLLVSFAFEGLTLEQRHRFLKVFDAHLQRGGG